LVHLVNDQADRPARSAEERAPDDQGTVTYLTGHFPMVSHTFILREVLHLRRIGVRVATASVRRPDRGQLIGQHEIEAERSTFYLASAAANVVGLVHSHLRCIVGNPARWFNAAGLAWKTRHRGLAAWVRQLAYFLEAGLLASHMQQSNTKHLHNHFADSSYTVAMLASAMTGIPFSFTVHGPAEFYDVARWRLDEKVARAKFVACISHFTRSQMMLFSDQAHWHKLKIVHCGVEPEYYGGAGRDVFGKRVLFVGRLVAVKGVRLLIEAVGQLRRSHPDLKLTIVGDGSERAALEALTSELGLTDLVTFAGYRPQHAVADILRDTDMLVLPSFAEGVPIVLMEAMASRLPVIASQVAGVPELVEDGVTGFLVPPGDQVALANRLDALLSQPRLAAEMGKSGRIKVERDFDIEKEAAQLKALIEAP